MKTAKVLIVDDSPRERQNLTELIKSALPEYDTHCYYGDSYSGIKGRLNGGSYDIAIIDLYLKGSCREDALGAARCIMENQPSCVRVGISIAGSTALDLEKCGLFDLILDKNWFNIEERLHLKLKEKGF